MRIYACPVDGFKEMLVKVLTKWLISKYKYELDKRVTKEK
jgi:hypothetical protein